MNKQFVAQKLLTDVEIALAEVECMCKLDYDKLLKEMEETLRIYIKEYKAF